MKVQFLGVGEACDERCPNTSLQVTAGNGQRFLLDCGFTTPHLYFAGSRDPDELDAVWISHFHGDHFFGMPLLLLRFWEMGRTKKLVIAGQRGTREKITAAMELAYPGFLPRLRYHLDFAEIEPGQVREIAGTSWRAAENIHSQRCLALCVADSGHRIFYSGDGRPTRETESLARGCDLIVHEAFRLDEEVENHGSVRGCLEFAGRAGGKHLALVHLQRDSRESARERIADLARDSGLHVFLPEPGDIFSL
ncbi:MAG: MBL fold metallo-hydrolase [Desulfobulbaceae bacterium]|nr:MBL fold metallo-hydrolase [Desulfobulbaceae bacterium]